jgi:hypothetical protein
MNSFSTSPSLLEGPSYSREVSTDITAFLFNRLDTTKYYSSAVVLEYAAASVLGYTGVPQSDASFRTKNDPVERCEGPLQIYGVYS